MWVECVITLWHGWVSELLPLILAAKTALHPPRESRPWRLGYGLVLEIEVQSEHCKAAYEVKARCPFFRPMALGRTMV
jgi:hypothetical protein